MFPCMALRSPRPVSRWLHEKLVRTYAQEAARLRDLAVNVTTPRLRSRLLEEAENQERLAQTAKRGIIQPHPQPTGQCIGKGARDAGLSGHPNS